MDRLKNSSWKERGNFVASFLVYVGCTYLILLYMQLWRPIWEDEFLQFAVAAEPSSKQAWALIHRSILAINHNQTGVYMMLDYWLEEVGGANSTLLRLPSILCGCLFLISVVELFRLLGYSVMWTFLALIALLGQQTTMYFVGEARPYFPLAAATLGALVYYLAKPEDRRGIIRFCGFTGITIGVLFHPYFSVYWIAVVVITLLRLRIEENKRLEFSLILRHVNVPLCIFGTTVYFTVALNTWMRRNVQFSEDPWRYLGDPWPAFAGNMHFQFILRYMPYVAVVTCLAVVVLIALPEQRRGSLARLVTPCLLIGTMLALSIFLAAVSYFKHYWIFQRQWIASAAILPLAFIWLWAEIGRLYDRLLPRLSMAVWLLAFFALFDQARSANADYFDGLSKYVWQHAVPSDCDKKRLAAEEKGPDGKYKQGVIALEKSVEADIWVDMANSNIQCGGPVWSVFRVYYAANAPEDAAD